MFDMTQYPPSPLNGQPRRRRVALLGGIAGQRALAPYEDPSWDVWSMNLIPALDARGRFRADRWFELHERCAQSEDDEAWIRRCPVPIYVPDAEMASLNPRAVIYPLAQVESLVRNYWACTMAYQLALALAEGYEEVGLYGIDLRQGTLRERTVEWACLSWWAGFLTGKGVTVTVPHGTWLGQHVHHARYGLDYEYERDAVAAYTENTLAVAFEEEARRATVTYERDEEPPRTLLGWFRGR